MVKTWLQKVIIPRAVVLAYTEWILWLRVHGWATLDSVAIYYSWDRDCWKNVRRDRSSRPAMDGGDDDPALDATKWLSEK